MAQTQNNTPTTEPIHGTVRVGYRWALVTDYGNLSGGIGRQGWWCEDAGGGWGTSRRSADAAIDQCVRPVLYATKQEALDTVGAR